MTVNDLMSVADIKAVSISSPEREIKGGYVGDLLSWVMGSASAGDVWITIMSNVNIVAVATLADTACILLAEGVSIEPDVLRLAQEKGVNILCSERPAFELAGEIFGRL